MWCEIEDDVEYLMNDVEVSMDRYDDNLRMGYVEVICFILGWVGMLVSYEFGFCVCLCIRSIYLFIC